MNLVKVFLYIFTGNALVVAMLVGIEYLLNVEPYWLNILGCSGIFALLTIPIIFWTNNRVNNYQNPNIMFLSGGMALLRIVVSLIWMSFVKNSLDILFKSVVFEFILIYLFYLSVDIYYLSRILNRSK